MSPDTVTDTLDDLGRRGFTDHFMVRGRKLVAIDAGRPFLPRDVVIREYHRFEGVSDPEYSDPAVGAMLDVLRIEPGRREAA